MYVFKRTTGNSINQLIINRGYIYLRGATSKGVLSEWKKFPSINTDVKMDDFVIESVVNNQGTEWQYRKWNSGIAECWHRVYFEGLESIEQADGYYKFEYVFDLPITFSTYRYTSNVTIRLDSGNPAMLCGLEENEDTVKITFLNTDGSNQGYITLHILGYYV